MDPLIPRPWITAIACGLVILLGVNLVLDYKSVTYGGASFTYAICGLIATVLGFPVGIGLLRRDSHDRRQDGEPK